MARTLLLYHSGYGHTRKISERIAEALRQDGEAAETRALLDNGVACSEDELAGFNTIVIGASIRNGKHKPAVSDFIERNLDMLRSRVSVFFSVNLVARKPGKDTAETNPYLLKFLESCPLKPDLVGVFAGNLNYRRYGFFDRQIIRFIMWMTKGPTDPATDVEYTDWDQVDQFAERIAELPPATGDPSRQA